MPCWILAQDCPSMPSVRAPRPQVFTPTPLQDHSYPPPPVASDGGLQLSCWGIKVQLSGYCRAIVMIKPGTYLCCKWGAVERSSRADPTVTSGSLIIRVTATSWNGISSTLPRFNVILRKITQTVKKSEMNPSNELQRICSVITKVSKEQS